MDWERRMAVGVGVVASELRRERGLTAEQVAEQVGMMRPNVSRFEKSGRRYDNRGLPQLPTIKRFADLYGLRLSEFVERAEAVARKLEIAETLEDIVEEVRNAG